MRSDLQDGYLDEAMARELCYSCFPHTIITAALTTLTVRVSRWLAVEVAAKFCLRRLRCRIGRRRGAEPRGARGADASARPVPRLRLHVAARGAAGFTAVIGPSAFTGVGPAITGSVPGRAGYLDIDIFAETAAAPGEDHAYEGHRCGGGMAWQRGAKITHLKGIPRGGCEWFVRTWAERRGAAKRHRPSVVQLARRTPSGGDSRAYGAPSRTQTDSHAQHRGKLVELSASFH
jgi:hypothetical protein